MAVAWQTKTEYVLFKPQNQTTGSERGAGVDTSIDTKLYHWNSTKLKSCGSKKCEVTVRKFVDLIQDAKVQNVESCNKTSRGLLVDAKNFGNIAEFCAGAKNT